MKVNQWNGDLTNLIAHAEDNKKKKKKKIAKISILAFSEMMMNIKMEWKKQSY